jgi:hypothetical protein
MNAEPRTNRAFKETRDFSPCLDAMTKVEAAFQLWVDMNRNERRELLALISQDAVESPFLCAEMGSRR